MKSIARRPLFALAAAALALGAAACAPPGPTPARDDTVAWSLSYGFYTLKPGSFRLRPATGPGPGTGLSLVFSTVPGSITGPPSGGPLSIVPVEGEETFELVLPARMGRRAERFDSPSLTIEPADTRVARLGTFHEYPQYGRFRGGGGFLHAPSGATMLLVYFSGPATLQGSIEEPTGTYHYDVTVDRAGWAWLIARAREDGGFAVRAYTGPVDAIEFAVLLPPMMIRDGAGDASRGPGVGPGSATRAAVAAAWETVQAPR